MPELLDIAEVRQRTGLPVSTLHFYERNGLIASAGRVGLRRQYNESTVERLAVIILCQRAGFTLAEIGDLLATNGGPAWKELAREKLAQVHAEAEALQTIERGLRHAVECPSPNVLRCEHFRAELRAVIPVQGHPEG